MKKFMLTGAVLCVALAFNSCGTKESAFKKMYEKAKTEEQTGYNATDTQTANDTPVVAPLEEKPANETNVVDNYDNVSVRQENVSVVDGSGLQAYSVVVGSFSVKANAQGLQQRLKSAGYNAQLAYNADSNMYRVVATTSSDKGEAARSRNQLRAQYPDAWLLYTK